MLALRTTAHRSLALAIVATVAAGSASVGLASLAPIATAHGQDRGGRAESDAPAGAEPDAPETAADDVDAESSERVEGGEKVKAIRFSGLDVSGRLKSPQLLYFLNRLRAEFDRPRLPHRSFLPEMERSTRTKSF